MFVFIIEKLFYFIITSKQTIKCLVIEPVPEEPKPVPDSPVSEPEPVIEETPEPVFPELTEIEKLMLRLLGTLLFYPCKYGDIVIKMQSFSIIRVGPSVRTSQTVSSFR